MGLHRFQHCTGHITTGSWKGRENQYIQFVRVLYCKLPTNGKQLPAFPLEGVPGTESWPQRWEARVLPLCHRGSPPLKKVKLQVKHFPKMHVFIRILRKQEECFTNTSVLLALLRKIKLLCILKWIVGSQKQKNEYFL